MSAMSLDTAFEAIPTPISAEIVSRRAPRAAPAPRIGEGAEAYPHVVVVLDAKRRVVECAAGLQWIVQVRRGRRWEGVSFCWTKEALLRITGSDHPALLALPDRFPEQGRQA
jgi:hypothetical protein